MSSATWKTRERKVAAALGGRRVPVSGRGDGPDVAHAWLSIEVKQRRALPAWLQTALSQARRAAAAGQLPVAVVHEHGRHDSLVVMALSDFVDWFGDMPAGEGENHDDVCECEREDL